MMRIYSLWTTIDRPDAIIDLDDTAAVYRRLVTGVQPLRHPLGDVAFTPGDGGVAGFFRGRLAAEPVVVIIDTESRAAAAELLDDIQREQAGGVLSAAALTNRIAEDLLRLANDVWLDDDEQITADQLRSGVTLRSLTVAPDGAFGAVFRDDADVFAGHAIEVTGTMADGAVKATISG